MSRRSLAGALVLCSFALVAAAAVVMREADRSTRCPSFNTPVGEQLTAHTAATSVTLARGLAHRDELDTDGLLLEWSESGRHPIWMAFCASTSSGWMTGVTSRAWSPTCLRAPAALVRSSSRLRRRRPAPCWQCRLVRRPCWAFHPASTWLARPFRSTAVPRRHRHSWPQARVFEEVLL